MKPTTVNKFLLASFVAAITLSISQSAQAQLPLVVDGTQTTNPNQIEPTNNTSTIAAGSGLQVSCQDLKTVVHKGDLEAVMVSWNYDGFGRDYTPSKRCQIVSERLQQAANLNGGTFKNLQLASGTLNSQSVVCALQSNERECNGKNILFTLKPENAHNPESIIQKIFTFAQDGSSSLNESASRKSQVDMNLGDWEQQAFAGATKRSSAANIKKINTGF